MHSPQPGRALSDAGGAANPLLIEVETFSDSAPPPGVTVFADLLPGRDNDHKPGRHALPIPTLQALGVAQ